MRPSTDRASWTKHIDFTILDLLVLAGSFAIAYRLKFGSPGFILFTNWRSLLALLLLTDLAITLLTNPYSGVLRRSYWEDVSHNIRLALYNFIVASVVFYVLKVGVGFSREMVISTFLIYLAASTLLKALWKRILISRQGNLSADSMTRLLLVTSTEKAAEVEELVNADDVQSYEVAGFCLLDGTGQDTFEGRPVADVAGLYELASNVFADEVLVAADLENVDADVFDRLMENGVRVRFAITESLGIDSEVQSVGRAGVYKTLDLERYTFGTRRLLYLPVKRLLDIVFGLLGAVLTLPVLAFVKIAYLAAGDTHSILYTHKRVGFNGREFDLLKIRSMVWNADEVLVELLKDPENQRQWERGQKIENDPRITPVGRFIRKTSLDEFPQFINVLKGDMSIVGPRPLVPGELESHGGRMLYNRVKPGITGWWACNGRSNIEYRERLELEYYYVSHCSPYLDVLCVLRTVGAVLKKDGAV